MNSSTWTSAKPTKPLLPPLHLAPLRLPPAMPSQKTRKALALAKPASDAAPGP